MMEMVIVMITMMLTMHVVDGRDVGDVNSGG